MFRPLTALGSLLVLAVFLFGAATVDAQTPTSTTLVSNNGQATSNNVVFGNDLAIPFETGSSSNGYKLTSVAVQVSGFANPSLTVSHTFTVSIHTGSGTSVGASVGTLSSSSLSTGTNTFSSADGIDLLADTTYSVVLDITSPGNKNPRLWLTSSQDEDSGGAPGWTIGNAFYFRSGTTWSSSIPNRVPKMTIEGYTIQPRISSAAVNRETLTVTFDRALDPDSEPSGQQFTVSATPSGGTARTIAGKGTVAVSDATVTVTLASAVAWHETVTVSYSEPTQNPLRLATGNVNVAPFSNQAVSNNTPLPTGTTLIANTGQSDAQTVYFHFDHFAVPFMTGANTLGYTLTSVQIAAMIASSQLSPAVAYTAYISAASGSTVGAKVGSLTNPTLGNGINSLLSTSGGIDLEPGTLYFLVLQVTWRGNRGTRFVTTLSDNEDSGGADGWSIGNQVLLSGAPLRGPDASRYIAGPGGWASQSDGHVFKVDIRGVEKTPPESSAPDSETDPTLTPPEDTISAPEVKFGRRTPGEQYQFNGETRTVGSDGSWLMRHCVIYDRWGTPVEWIWGGTGPCPDSGYKR